MGVVRELIGLYHVPNWDAEVIRTLSPSPLAW